MTLQAKDDGHAQTVIRFEDGHSCLGPEPTSATCPRCTAAWQASPTRSSDILVCVDSLAEPGSNATGFTSFEYAIGAKWLALLKEIAPAVKRVAVFRDPNDPAGSGQWGAIQSAAPSLGVELRPLNSRAEAGEIERTIANFARQPDGGLILTASAGTAASRDWLIPPFAQHRLPTIFPNDFYVASGGLISYGTDIVDQYRQAAGYVDRILKGEKPADLPVQTPTRFKLTVNLKTAKTLRLEVPPMLLARADEVIE